MLKQLYHRRQWPNTLQWIGYYSKERAMSGNMSKARISNVQQTANIYNYSPSQVPQHKSEITDISEHACVLVTYDV